ncbi:MAG: tetratricopeptide repeat protein [Pirellulaceae bacterium]|nr:tetratricopeptide repeat protein [Pirellulaceae bacterium]
MDIRLIILCGFVTPGLVMTAPADEWIPFERASYTSPNGSYEVVLVKDQTATILASDGKELARWQVEDIPSCGFVDNKGRYFVTLGRYGGSSWESLGLAVYSGSGELLRKWSIRQLVGEDDVKRSISALWWFDPQRSGFTNDSGCFKIQLLMEDSLLVNLTTFDVVRKRIPEDKLDALARFRRGEFYEHRGEIEEAKREYDTGLALSYSPGIARRLARVYFRHGMHEDAEKTLLEAIRRSPKVGEEADAKQKDHVPWSYYDLSKVYEAMGRSKESLEMIEKGQACMWRPHGEFEKALGIAYLKNGKDQEAKEAFQRYIETYNASGGRDELGRKQLTEVVLRHCKPHGRAFRILGDVHCALRNWSEAANAYTKARYQLRLAGEHSTDDLDRLIADMKARTTDAPVQRD